MSSFRVGDLVMVAPRLFPGSNKQGGVGRVTYVHTCGSVDVSYVVGGGRESKVPSCYVEKHSLSTDRRRTKRSSLEHSSPERPPPALENKLANKHRFGLGETVYWKGKTALVTGLLLGGEYLVQVEEGENEKVHCESELSHSLPTNKRQQQLDDEQVSKSQTEASGREEKEHLDEENQQQNQLDEENADEKHKPVAQEQNPASKTQYEVEESTPDRAEEEDMEEKEENGLELFTVGQVVTVASRTHPGVNKPGGVGRITRANEDGTYNIKYVVGGSEKNVHRQYISKSQQEDPQQEQSGRKGRKAKSKAELSIMLHSDTHPEHFEEELSPAELHRKTKRHKTNAISRLEFAPSYSTSTCASTSPPSCTNHSQHRVQASPEKDEGERHEEKEDNSLELDARQVIETSDPNEVFRRTKFTQLVSSAFLSRMADCMDKAELFQVVKSKGLSVEIEEFEQRLRDINQQGKVMVYGNLVYKV